MCLHVHATQYVHLLACARSTALLPSPQRTVRLDPISAADRDGTRCGCGCETRSHISHTHSTATADEGQGMVTPSKAARQYMTMLELLLILGHFPVACPARL